MPFFNPPCYGRGRNSKDVKVMAIAKKFAIAAAALALGVTAAQKPANAQVFEGAAGLFWLTSAIAALYAIASVADGGNQRPISP